MRTGLALLLLWVGCGPLWAADLSLPAAAQLTVERSTLQDSFNAPVGPFEGGSVPFRSVEGAVTRQAWRMGGGGLTPLQVIAPLREQIAAQGYDLAFECDTRDCGGFDFRFAVEVLPGPNMYVNIGAFRYLTAFKGPEADPDEVLTVLASVTTASSYVQIIKVVKGTPLRPPVGVAPIIAPDPSNPASDLIRDGYMVLRDLDFATGSTQLGAGPFDTLEQLAKAMNEWPAIRVVLVGHTDDVGGLAPNIVVSRARAEAVRARLVSDFEIEPARLDAEGVGYLSPLASNTTPEGREKNRRVEAVVLPGNSR